MDEQHPQLPEAMDACRPDSDDLLLPEMRDLAEQIQQDPATQQLFEYTQHADRVIAAAMHDVPVPANLAETLLRSLGHEIDSPAVPLRASDIAGSAREAGQTETGVTKAGDANAKVTLPASLPARKGNLLRLIAAISICLCVAVFASVKVLYPPERPKGPLLDEIRDRVSSVMQGQWQRDLQRSPRRGEFALQENFKNARQWQRLVTPYDEATVVYDLRPNAGQPFAALFVVRTRQRFAVSERLPRIPDSTTGGFCMGVFQQDGVVFVLVVEGNEGRYSRFAGPVNVVI